MHVNLVLIYILLVLFYPNIDIISAATTRPIPNHIDFHQLSKGGFIMLKKIFIMLFVIMYVCLSFYSVAFAEDEVDETRQKIDSKVIKIVKILGYFVILLFAIKDVLKELQMGDIQGIGSVVIKYLIVYAVLLGLPVALRWVEVFIEELKM